MLWDYLIMLLFFKLEMISSEMFEYKFILLISLFTLRVASHIEWLWFWLLNNWMIKYVSMLFLLVLTETVWKELCPIVDGRIIGRLKEAFLWLIFGKESTGVKINIPSKLWEKKLFKFSFTSPVLWPRYSNWFTTLLDLSLLMIFSVKRLRKILFSIVPEPAINMLL